MTRANSAKLILASGSPRRRELLARAGVAFEAIESGIDERRLADEDAETYALRMAREKAGAVAARRPEALVLGADTVVEVNGNILGKPRDRADACRMLGLLSARTHRVITGFALMRGARLLVAQAATSMVTFRALSADEIERYAAGDEPYDKAGAYAVQGEGAHLIAAVEGSVANVMGLPVEEVVAAMKGCGASPREGDSRC